MNIFKKLLLLLVSGILFSSCSENTDPTPDEFIVVTSADNPPYEYIENGEIIGFDIDIAATIATRLNQKLIIKNVDFQGILPSLLTKKVDAAIAGLSITEERAKNIDFSDIYHSTAMAVLLRKSDLYQNITQFTYSKQEGENNSNQYNSSSVSINFSQTPNYKNISDFADKVIGCQFGTTWELFANEIVKNSSVGYVKALPNNLQIVQELNNGNIDAAIMEDFQTIKFVSRNPNLAKYLIEGTKSEFAIALPKNSSLTKKINEILAEIKEDGTLDKLRSKWFGQ